MIETKGWVMEIKRKQDILVYGAGNFFQSNKNTVEQQYNIIAIIDKNKQGTLEKWKIIKPDEHKEMFYEKIVIMVENINDCFLIVSDLLDCGVESEKIALGNCLYGCFKYDEIKVLSNGRLCVYKEKIKVSVGSTDEFNNVCEVFLNQIYNYFLNNKKKDIVIDVGMNIGDATLYFLDLKNVEKVYGYEPFNDTFLHAKENLKKYLNSDRMDIFQYGISNENASRTIGFNSNMTCGQSSIESVREKQFQSYLSWGLAKASGEKMEEINVKKASEVFGPIIAKYPNHNIILKMDCEGEEYGIIEELSQANLLDKFAFIMLEWHYQGKESLLRDLEKADFSWWGNDKDGNMGLIYAYKMFSL
ncbi:MAG: FkbM family methyltransferase [Lachnospiraceae bacterium]|nr:FkbM family methyltransferase [Lachnospiraceae bacterium]